ncbi:Uncharacterized protein BM_BM1461 [Brugia malayi]|uniref:Bm1461 n=1 Tax=Brugia malayi TaxID=6279 RepID=A0A0K0J1B2_BRUMA|nr:Uncharacterized protein BM_BM1461 [Brugia malayi]CDP99162.1 Bm1461 [Brugia malayi]VIO91229.1 Uncharacterized protein BM_BM1461 [Brugia malayi]
MPTVEVMEKFQRNIEKLIISKQIGDSIAFIFCAILRSPHNNNARHTICMVSYEIKKLCWAEVHDNFGNR